MLHDSAIMCMLPVANHVHAACCQPLCALQSLNLEVAFWGAKGQQAWLAVGATATLTLCAGLACRQYRGCSTTWSKRLAGCAQQI